MSSSAAQLSRGRPPSRGRLAELVLESATDFAILTTDLGGIITSWNGAAERTMGWPEGEAVGQDACMIFTPEDRANDACGQEMARARRHGRATDERWHLRQDGSRFWGSGSMMRLEDDETGQHLGYVKIVRDRTTQHEAGRRLEASEALLRTIFDNSADCLKLITSDGKLRSMNRAGLRLLEIEDFEDVAGKDWVSIWPEGERNKVEAALAEAAAGKVGRFQGRCPTARGTLKWLDVQVTSLPGSHDEPGLLVASSRDVSERESAQEALRISEERLRAALSIRTVGVLFWGPGFGLVEANDAFLQMTGFSREEAIGKTWQELTPPEFHAASLQAVAQVSMGGEATPYEKQYYRKDGSRWWGLFAPRRISDGEVVEFVLDITDRKSAEQELRELNERLEGEVSRRTEQIRQQEEALRQSQKMEAVGQLTGGLAHDFNNLLTGIIGGMELLSTRVAQGRFKDVDRYVSVAQEAAKRAAALTHRLLAFSRRQTLDPKPTDVNRLVADMEDLLRRTAGPETVIEVVAAAGLWTALVDPNQLENALLNLCINARDAMPGGGRIVIETANKWLDARVARECDVPPGQYLSLSVGDTGTGMTPEVQARAFDPFFTTKPLGQGTGLGLSMIYGFVRQSGGQVCICSEVGQGTTMCLYLPRYLGAEDTAEPAPEPAEASRAQQGETVLVVDDEPTVRMLVTEVLQELGYTAIEAADGAGGLRVLQSDVRIDLLVTDVGLPGALNGRQVADAARVTRPDLKVLFITGYAESAVFSHGHLDPGVQILTKPFAMEALASRIGKMITGKENGKPET